MVSEQALQNELKHHEVRFSAGQSDNELMMLVVKVGMFCFPFIAFTMPNRDSPISIGSIDTLALGKLLALFVVLACGSMILAKQWQQARTQRLTYNDRNTPVFFQVIHALTPYFAFLGWAFLSVTWSPRISVSLGQAGGVTSLLIIACLVALISSKAGGTERILKCLCLSLLILSFFILLMHFAFPGLSGLDRRMLIAGEDGIIHPTAASANASLGLLLATCCLFVQRYGWARQMLIAAVVIHGPVLILASSRAALGMTFVTIPFCIFLTGDNRRRAWIGMSAGLGCLFLLITNPGFHSFSSKNNLGVSYIMRGQSLTQLQALSGREEMWTKVWAEYLKSPLKGHGYFLTSSAGELEVWGMLANHTAHNIYLQVLSGTGLVGLILFVAAIASLLLNFLKLKYGDNQSRQVLVILGLVMLWFAGWSLFSASFMGPVRSESVVFYTLIGLGIGQCIRISPLQLKQRRALQLSQNCKIEATSEAPSTRHVLQRPAFLTPSRIRSVLAILDQAVVSGTSFFTVVIVERACGAAGLGLFSLAMSAVILARGIQDSVISTPFTVFRSRVVDRMNPAAYAGASLLSSVTFAGILVVITTTASVAFNLISPSTEIITLIWVLTLTVPCAILKEFARRFDMANHNMASALTLDIGVSVLQLGLLVTLATLGVLTTASSVLLVGCSCIVMALAWLGVRHTAFQFERGVISESVKTNWELGRWLLVDQVVCFLQLYGMHWLLGLMIAPSATGIFTACASIAALAGPFLAGIGNYLSPQFAETITTGNRRNTLILYLRTTAVLAMTVGAFVVIAVLYGSELLQFIYNNPELQGYSAVVSILAVRMLFGIPALGAHHALVAMEYPRGSMQATIFGTTVSLLLAIPLVIHYEVIGSAIALAIGTACETAYLLISFRNRFKQWQWQQASPSAGGESNAQ